jgi:small subunit ribosomal protein S4
MSRYTGPKMRIIRRLGNLPGLARKWISSPFLPGQHRYHTTGFLIGRNRRRLKRLRSQKSPYALRLEAKQKVRFNYGMTETQMKLRFLRAKRKGLSLSQLLEVRLDSVVFRLGLAPTLVSARQMVIHGHIRVSEGRMRVRTSPRDKPGLPRRSKARYRPFVKVSVPGYECTPSQEIGLARKGESFCVFTGKRVKAE